MVNRSEKTYNSVMVIQRSDYKWGVTDLEGNIIVPFGKYGAFESYISEMLLLELRLVAHRAIKLAMTTNGV